MSVDLWRFPVSAIAIATADGDDDTMSHVALADIVRH
jgi:hypothetical protein